MRAIYLLGTFVALVAGLTAAAEGRVYEDDAEWDPSLLDERGLEDVEDDDLDIDQADEPIPEAQNYYRLVVDQHKRWKKIARKVIKGVAIGSVMGGKRKRSVDALESRSNSGINVMGYILGTEAEDAPYRSRGAIRRLRASKVIQADLYERPLAPGLPKNIQDALDGKQNGVVITLENGRKFLVLKGNQYGEGRAPAIIPANRMAPDWKKITSKAVSNSVVGDFISAAKRGYDVINNNGNQAAARMMLLP